jgi:predicted TIM-barrel fold metal-dependent hydrolase
VSSPTRPSAHRIDVHHHAILPRIQELMRERGASFTLPWSLPETWQVMAANEIDFALVSNPIPGDFFDGAEVSARFHRAANDAVAEFVAEYPDRFGLLAALPMPYVDAALAELAYCLDELHADGVVLIPHAGDDYIGDPLYQPLFEELDRRRAVVLVHPLTLPGARHGRVPTVLADFLLDTTRGAINLILTGALDRYPGITFILSHGGGFLPYAASRIQTLGTAFYDVDAGRVAEALGRFYFDLALTSPSGLPSLLESVPVDRILFGTDWSAAPAGVVAAGVAGLVAPRPGFTDEMRASIDRGNALRLFPGIESRSLTAAGRRV